MGHANEGEGALSDWCRRCLCDPIFWIKCCDLVRMVSHGSLNVFVQIFSDASFVPVLNGVQSRSFEMKWERVWGQMRPVE